jgi:hypothetical protein
LSIVKDSVYLFTHMRGTFNDLYCMPATDSQSA